MSETKRFIGEVTPVLAAAALLIGGVALNSRYQTPDACRLSVPADARVANASAETDPLQYASPTEIGDIYAPTVVDIAECALQIAKSNGELPQPDGGRLVEINLSTSNGIDWDELNVQMSRDDKGNPDPSTAYAAVMQKHRGISHVIDTQIVIYNENAGLNKTAQWHSTYRSRGSADSPELSVEIESTQLGAKVNKEISDYAKVIAHNMAGATPYSPLTPTVPVIPTPGILA